MPNRSALIQALLIALLAGFAQGQKRNPAPPPADGRLHEIVGKVSAQRIEATIEKLVSFGTRHTLSDTLSDTRGIGAARRWIKAEFDLIKKDRRGKLEVFFHRTMLDSGANRRIVKDVEIVNVIAIQRGKRYPNRYVIMAGDIDNRVSNPVDYTSDSPGANDNASGMAGVIEAARVLSQYDFDASILYAGLSGEEQGLFGGKFLAQTAVEDGWDIIGVLNNDMIGWTNDHRLDNTIRYSNPGIRDIQHAAAIRFSDLITYDALYYKSTDAAAYYEVYGDIVGGIGSYPVLGNPHYHQSHDRLETINQQLVAEVSKTTVATLMLLASSPARIDGLVVTDGVATWETSPESGISGYEVRWQTDMGWRTEQVTESSARLVGLLTGGAVMVRALHESGTVGWDWARAG